MIIDGHGHACGEYLDLASIKQKLSASGTDIVVLTAGELNSSRTYWMNDTAEKYPSRDKVNDFNKVIGFITKLSGAVNRIPEGNQYVYELKQQAPNQIRQYYWILQNKWQDIERDYKLMKFDGVKLHQCWEHFDVGSTWFEEVGEWIISMDLPLFIHLHDYKQVKKMIAFIKAHPKAKIIIAHMYGAEYFLEEGLSYLENTYFDISNSYGISSERMMKVYKRLGSTKLLLGSDTPYGKEALKRTIHKVQELNISSSEKDNILGESLKELLKIN